MFSRDEHCRSKSGSLSGGLRGRHRARSPSPAESSSGDEDTIKQTPGFDAEDVHSDEDDTFDSRPRKKSKITTNLTDEQEENLVEWLFENSIFYNKKAKAYKDTARKRRLWREKAEELGVEADIMEIWYKSIRTRYGKLLLKKSREGEEQLTERDNWILEKFHFLSGHIVRCHKRTAVSLKEKIDDRTGRQSQPSTEVEVVSDDDGHHVPDTQDRLPNLSIHRSKISHKPPSQIGKNRGMKSFTLEREDDALIQTLAERLESARALRDQILSHVPDKTTDRTVFGDWMRENMNYIHPSLWRKFQRDAFNLMMNYHDETDQCNSQRQLLNGQTFPQSLQLSSSPSIFTGQATVSRPATSSVATGIVVGSVTSVDDSHSIRYLQDMSVANLDILTSTSSPSDIVLKTEPSTQ